MMAGKRKRNRPGREIQGENKRQRISGNFNSKDPVIKTAVLAQYYPKVLSLREYLLSKLPTTSKIRRKKILSVGKKPQSSEGEHTLNILLDQTLVGVSKHKEVSQEERLQQWASFSQRADTSDSNIGNTTAIGRFSQLEVGR
jgi:telomerase reverse transcriptase